MTTSAPPKRHRRLSVSRAIIYGILILFVFFYVLPVYLILITSFKQYTDIDL